MQPATGYYSIIQYCPDASRLEAVNVGVLLFCLDKPFQQAVVVGSNGRIRRLFGSEGHDWQRVNAYKSAIVERVKAEPFESLDGLNHFVASRGNLITLTPPRFVKVREPKSDLQRLFDELVGGSAAKPSRTSFKKDLAQKLLQPELQNRVGTDVRVHVPVLEKEVEIPYAFRNGRVNLIQPVRFSSQAPEGAQATACKYAVEGDALYDNPDRNLGELSLIVVGRFVSQEAQAPVQRILEKHHVKLYRHDQVDKLLDEIRRTGKVWNPAH